MKASRATNVYRQHRNLSDVAGTKNGIADASPFGDGSALTNAQPITVIIPIAGARVLRIRILSAAGGTLSHAFLRPDGVTPYPTNNPADVVVVGGTENKSDITCTGEGYLKLTFTPTATAALNYCDVMQVGPENESKV